MEPSIADDIKTIKLLKTRVDAWRTWCAHRLGTSADKMDKHSDEELRAMIEEQFQNHITSRSRQM